MTRAELVKKLTSYAVVDEEYAALFMETFLMLLHQQLHEHDSFVLPFKINFSQQKIVRNNEEFYLITCISTDPLDTLKEDLVFTVPSIKDELQPDKYAVFAIGITKQIIPTKEMVAAGFVFEPSFSLKKYFRGKAENFLRSGTFETKKIDEPDFAWNFASSNNKNQFSNDESLHEEISKEVQEFSWDFGNSWKRELQEEEILSVEPSQEDVFEPISPNKKEDVIAEEAVSWNFHDEETEEASVTKDEKISQTRIEDVNFSKLHDKLDKIEIGTEYQEVITKKTQELSIDLSDFEKLFDSDLHEEDSERDLNKNESLELDINRLDDEFVPVKSTTEFVLSQEEERLLAATDPFSNFTVEKTDFKSKDNSTVPLLEENIISYPSDKTLVEEEQQIREVEHAVEKIKPVKKERGNLFWSIISAVLIIVIIIFLYWKMWGLPHWLKMQQQTGQLVKNKPVVVEREYNIPVTYPYEVKITEAPKPEQSGENQNQNIKVANEGITAEQTPAFKNDLEASDIFSKNNPNNQIGKNIKQTPLQSSSSKPVTVERKEPLKKKEVIKEDVQGTKKAVLIRDNIYLEGSKYVVQLSSWKSETIADQEVARLLRKGIKAFKSSVVIPQKGGTWYRVKVGGFSSAEDASRFYNSIK
ncbi:MAG: SPOR domain-containing protein [Ignavibacteriaceae bacterium]|jgi:cell division protein FtsN